MYGSGIVQLNIGQFGCRALPLYVKINVNVYIMMLMLLVHAIY